MAGHARRVQNPVTQMTEDGFFAQAVLGRVLQVREWLKYEISIIMNRPTIFFENSGMAVEPRMEFW
jgi:hypothetical protein